MLVRYSPAESPCGVLEHNTLPAEFWFNRGRRKSSRHDRSCLGRNASKLTKTKIIATSFHYFNRPRSAMRLGMKLICSLYISLCMFGCSKKQTVTVKFVGYSLGNV